MSRSASRRQATRLGALSIFVIVIGLCIAVLSVLSLASSQASARLSEKQAESVQQMYDLEQVGQTFCAHLDSWLKALSDSGADTNSALRVLTTRVSDAAVESASFVTLREGDEIQVSNAEVLIGADFSTMTGTDAGRYPGGAFVTFTNQAGQQLICTVGITQDLGYQVLEWKMTRAWNEDAGNEKLWQG
ncbi:MAG: hypothetical protein HFJ65_04740 [Eggerthellaceae bacterium]|nr:hypothetical protein [Eggerthellaceae bacterium]